MTSTVKCRHVPWWEINEDIHYDPGSTEQDIEGTWHGKTLETSTKMVRMGEVYTSWVQLLQKPEFVVQYDRDMVSLYPQHSILQLAPSQQHQSFHTQGSTISHCLSELLLEMWSYVWSQEEQRKESRVVNSRELRPTYHRRHRNRRAASFKSRKVKLDISSAVGTALTFSHT